MLQSQELSQLYSRFKERAERSGAKVALVGDLAEAAQFVAATMAEKAEGAVVLPPALAEQPAFQTALGQRLRRLTDTASVTSAVAGASLVYFALIYADRLVPDLDQATPLVRKLQVEEGRRYISFVTGPSRTADIERVLTIGVQGPKELFVVVIER